MVTGCQISSNESGCGEVWLSEETLAGGKNECRCQNDEWIGASLEEEREIDQKTRSRHEKRAGSIASILESQAKVASRTFLKNGNTWLWSWKDSWVWFSLYKIDGRSGRLAARGALHWKKEQSYKSAKSYYSWKNLGQIWWAIWLRKKEAYE